LSTDTSIARPTTLHNVIFHLPSKLGALHHCIQVYEWFHNDKILSTYHSETIITSSTVSHIHHLDIFCD
jgi:hypothetical protein